MNIQSNNNHTHVDGFKVNDYRVQMNHELMLMKVSGTIIASVSIIATLILTFGA